MLHQPVAGTGQMLPDLDVAEHISYCQSYFHNHGWDKSFYLEIFLLWFPCPRDRLTFTEPNTLYLRSGTVWNPGFAQDVLECDQNGEPFFVLALFAWLVNFLNMAKIADVISRRVHQLKQQD